MKRTFIVLLIGSVISFLCSCGTGMNIKKSQVKYFSDHFSATINNNSYKANAQRYGSPSLLQLFEIQNEIADSVSIKFNDNHELILSYKANDTTKDKIFKGQFVEKSYYEIFLRNKKKEIPNGFPIIFSSNNINRIRIALTNQGDLIVDNMWDEGGNIFIFGVGDKGRRQSFFKTNILN